MTSVVDTSVKFIHSTQSGSPILNGTAGSGIALLDALLVTGWGLQTAASLSVAGGVATITFSSTFPAVVDSVISVDGSSIAALNGEQKVTSVGSNKVSFRTAAADGVATGTITAKMAPAGWSKVFTGTNKAVYKSADPKAHGQYLRVDDSSPTSMRVVGYESLSDIDTGTGPFPTSAQQAGGCYWTKSFAAQNGANPFFIAADSRFVLVHLCPYAYASAKYVGGATNGFGDMIPTRQAGDAFATGLNGSLTETSNAADRTLDSGFYTGVWFPRDYTGLGGPVINVRRPLIGSNESVSGRDTSFGTFPSKFDGRLMLSDVVCSADGSSPIRCFVPGLYHAPQAGLSASFSRGNIVPGRGKLEGRNLFALASFYAGQSLSTGIQDLGISFVDITGPWR